MKTGNWKNIVVDGSIVYIGDTLGCAVCLQRKFAVRICSMNFDSKVSVSSLRPSTQSNPKVCNDALVFHAVKICS